MSNRQTRDRIIVSISAVLIGCAVLAGCAQNLEGINSTPTSKKIYEIQKSQIKKNSAVQLQRIQKPVKGEYHFPEPMNRRPIPLPQKES